MRFQTHIHIGHLLHTDIQAGGNTAQNIVRKLTVIHQVQTVFNLAQIKEKLFLSRCRADFNQRPGI